MYLIAFRGRPLPYLRVPGAPVFTNLPDAISAAKTFYGALAVPVCILDGPTPPPSHRIALPERLYTEADAITAFSWGGNADASRLTVKEFSAILAAVPMGVELAFGDYAADNSFVLVVRASNPMPLNGAVTGAEGVSYDYTGTIYLDPQSDGNGSALPIPDALRSVNTAEPDATIPDPTPGGPAGPTIPFTSGGGAPAWQYRVQTLAGILSASSLQQFSAAGAAEFEFGRFGAGEPFLLEVQDVGDECATIVYHGPNKSAPIPAPILSGVWGYNKSGKPGTETGINGGPPGDLEQFLTVQKPAGETWAADGGRLISINWGGYFATPDGLYQCFDSRVPYEWFGPVNLGTPRNIGTPALPDATDPNSRSAFVSLYDDTSGGNTAEAPAYYAYAVATYGAGEPRQWTEPAGVFGGTGRYGVVWDHTFTVAAPVLSMGPKPGAVITSGVAATMALTYSEKQGCVGALNTSGYDPIRHEFYIAGERNRLRFGALPGVLPQPEVGLITNDAGTGLGAVLEALTGTPCVQIGVGLGVNPRRGFPSLTVGPYLELGTGGPSPVRIPI